MAMQYQRSGMAPQSIAIDCLLKQYVHFVAVYVTISFFKIGSAQLFPKIIEFFGAVGINIFLFCKDSGVDKDKTDIAPDEFKIPY